MEKFYFSRKFLIPISIVSIFLSIGCASIIKQTTQSLQINTDPSGAKITIYNLRSGNQVLSTETPYVATLKRGDGYFKKAKYRILIERQSYDKKEILLEGTPNGWYLFGNIILGGLIGWFIVDPLTGGMWTLEPEAVSEKLAQKQSLNQSEDLKIVFCRVSDFPENIVKKLKPVQIRK